MMAPEGKMAASKTTPIPEPPAFPLLGHITQFKSDDSLQDLTRLHDIYGDIYRLRFPEGKSWVMVGSHRLINEVCDETRFQKSVNTELDEVRNLANDGLFTAKPHEENWGIAHRILVPAFGPASIRGMFDEMLDIAMQLVLKWARQGPSKPILAADDFTRLAFDTVALCSMDFRFNSFYRESTHPFIESMAEVLVESGKRFARPTIAQPFYRTSTKKYFESITMMREVATDIVETRRGNPDSKKKDLLAAMMNGIDTKTGKRMTNLSMVDNLITFLIAGHETTSGTLSFLFYMLLKNPDCYQQAQQEVDNVIGRGSLTVEKIFELKYVAAALRETLRLCSPIPGVAMEPREDTLLDNKYALKKGEVVSVFFTKGHLDPQVYGEDADVFRPERMLDENFERLQKQYPSAWKPFGNGARACIGRPFAWQEMLLTTALLLQNFNFSLHDPGYKLRLSETLTIKPKDFYIRATLRHGMTPVQLEHQLLGARTSNGSATGTNGQTPRESNAGGPESVKIPFHIFYGSNSGTCESLAQRLASNATSRGFGAPTLASLDSAKENLSTDCPVIIITSSYEGQAPDNAAQFVAWLKTLQGQSLEKVSFAVFGVGNREWANTFLKVPKLIDSALQNNGASQIADFGSTDLSDRDPFTDFERWENEVLWPALEKRLVVPETTNVQSDLVVQITVPRSSILRQEMNEAVVTGARALTGPGVPLKKHIEIQLPDGATYRAGDYLCVLPLNPRETVSRVLRRFRLPGDAVLTIEGDKQAPLPIRQPTSAWDILSAYLELSQPATERHILTLAQFTTDSETKQKLDQLAGAVFHEQITKNRVSVLDLLERFDKVELPLSVFLRMLPPMRIRQYSIACSPLKSPSRISVAYSTLDAPSLSGQGRHIGVATSYLSNLEPNDVVHVATRPSHVAFHLPVTPETTPIICVAAGTGIGPFRGFVEERAEQLSAGRKLAPALLFYGCRGKADDLYREYFDAWESQGAVTLKRAYSRENSDESCGCKYVQERMLREAGQIGELWDQGAKLYICGSRAMNDGAEKAFVQLLEERKGIDEAEARAFLDSVRSERVATDVFT